MNFKSVLNDVCCDNRIKNGVIDLGNADHVFVLQEYLENVGFDIETIVDKTAQLFEAGKFPDRQAYNKDGILVTFPNKEYRDRAINKGTHFAENPKKGDTNIFTEPPADIEQKPEEPKGSIPIDTELSKKADDESDDSYEDRTPKEKTVDAQSVDYILRGETPLVNYSVDEAKRYGFYNKGLKWYDIEGNLIGEQIFDEKIGKPKITAGSKITAIDNPNIQTYLELTDKYKKGTASFRTDIFETMPLLVLFGITKLENAMSLSGDSKPDAVKYLSELGKSGNRLPSNYKENYINLTNELFSIGGQGGVSLRNIRPGATDFIHNSISEYRSILKDKAFLDRDVESKENTSDIVIIYGGTKKDLIDALKKTSSKDDLIIGADGVVGFKNNANLKFAQVSLKIGTSAKLGKITKKFFSLINQKEEPTSEPLNEGVTSFISNIGNKIAASISSAGEFVSRKMSAAYNLLVEKLKQIFKSVENIFKDIPIQEINAEDKKLEDLILDFESANNDSMLSYNVQNELENQKPVPITDCNYRAMKAFYDMYKTSPLNSLINVYNNYTSIKNSGGFKIKIENLKDGKKYEDIDAAIDNVYEIFENAAKNKNYFKESLTSESKKQCVLSGKNIKRTELGPILKLRANHIALRKIDALIKSIIKNTPNTEIATKDLPTVAANLSAEAVFGDNTYLPLIKFIGNKLENLGTRQEYINKKQKQFLSLNADDDKSNKIPAGFIHIYETTLKDSLHFQTFMYLLIDVESEESLDVNAPSPSKLMYAEINFTVGSGSKFAFNIEMNNILPLEQINSKLGI